MSGLIEHLLSPLVQTLAAARAGFYGGGMHGRVDAKHHRAAGGFVGGLSELLTGQDVLSTAAWKAASNAATELPWKVMMSSMSITRPTMMLSRLATVQPMLLRIQ